MSSGPARQRALLVFRNRNFTLLWATQFISEMGSGLMAVAAALLVYHETGNAASVGLIMVATTLPTLLFGLLAGVFVDRFDRKWIMILAQIVRAILALLLPVLIPHGLIWLYVIVFMSSGVKQFFDPARSSVLPEIVSYRELAAANAMMIISTIGSATIGFATAGLISSSAGTDWAFTFNGLVYAASVALITPVAVPALTIAADTSVRTVFRSLHDGLHYVGSSALFRSMILLAVISGIALGMSNSLSLPFAIEKLGATEFQFGILEGIFSIGFVMGSIVMAMHSDRIREGQWITLSYLSMGVVMIIVGGMSSVFMVGALSLVEGMLNAPSQVGRSLLQQRNTTRDIRGRVSSILAMIRDLSFMVGMLMAGIGDIVDLRLAVAFTGVLMLVGGGLSLTLPGLGRTSAEWRQTVATLRVAGEAPRLGIGRPASLADIEMLIDKVPVYGGLGIEERRTIIRESRVYETPSGTAVVRTGETSTAAYFLLEGRTIASRTVDHEERVLEVHNAGDFFGEIAAIQNVPRTANVTTGEQTTLLEVPAETLRTMMNDPALSAIFQAKMNERMLRLNVIEMPRFAGYDQEMLKDLRSSEPEPKLEPAHA